jgi:signal transduction histidine kinase
VNTEQVEALNESIASGKHLLSLINDVLDITKIEAGMMDLFVEEVDINAILSATLSVTKGLIKDKPIQLDTQIASDLPSTFGDKRRLRQVFINLVSNAVKFTSEGSVSIVAKHDNGGVEICVRDTGTGIAPEDQEAIFEPFKQARNNLKDAVGTGLGLPICKYFLESHGGSIRLESQLGEGSAFYVYLPVLSREQADMASRRLMESKK